jgi:hypothetical protein
MTLKFWPHLAAFATCIQNCVTISGVTRLKTAPKTLELVFDGIDPELMYWVYGNPIDGSLVENNLQQVVAFDREETGRAIEKVTEILQRHVGVEMSGKEIMDHAQKRGRSSIVVITMEDITSSPFHDGQYHVYLNPVFKAKLFGSA